MKEVVQFIQGRADEQERNPFIQWLDDDTVPARDRLSKWLKNGSFFIMCFKDFNSLVLRYPDEEAERDERKKAINAHADQDATHWAWYLNDIRTLGLDDELRFTDTLKFIWGDHIETQRRAIYRFCHLAAKAEDPVLRYCLIKSIESFGQIIFGRVTKVSEIFLKETDIRLRYLGQHHLDAEKGGLHDQDKIEDMLMKLKLDGDTRRQGLSIAAEACDIIEARWVEFYESVADR